MSEYNFKKIEKKWQEYWEKTNYGLAIDFSEKSKHYHLVEFPYPSGEGLHVGHCMGYGASDAYCRAKRMQGLNILFPIGWDAFGLPTENYAIKNKIKPSDATKKNTANFRTQMKSLGYSFDYSREVNTTDPAYYKWTQWIFLQFYKHAFMDNKLIKVADDDKTTSRLAYQAEMPVNWCPSCKINLANEEVINGRCERCGTETFKKMQRQWMLRITAYADRLIKDLDTVDYEERIKTQQLNWIGRSEGSEIKFRIKNKEENIKVFTTRADTLFGCTYTVLSPEHKLVEGLKTQSSNIKEIEDYVENAKKKSDIERTDLDKTKTGVEIKGIKAINPINNKEVSVWIADYVLANYGTGAVMAVPAHDKRDWEFAKKYNIKIQQVIKSDDEKYDDLKNSYDEYGVLINSDNFNGLTSKKAMEKITEKLKEIGAGDFAVNYKLRDWIFSRQHYWGEPIPIIHCPKCGTVPLSEEDLPLILPDIDDYEPTENGKSPLDAVSDWVNVKCPKCGENAKRETDTMPNWAGSSWYYLRYCDQCNDRQLASMDKLKYWTPIDIYNGGMEHTTLHLLYSRFWHKFLFDLMIVPTIEPYQKRIGHGIILAQDGQKMSKSRPNSVINPDEMIERFGADTLRAYIMFIGPYDQKSSWSMAGIQGVYRFFNRVWQNFNKLSDDNDSKELLIKLNQTIKSVSSDLENFSFNTIVAKLMELNNLIEKEKSISKYSYQKFLQILFPIAPHITSELWEIAKINGAIETSGWPKADTEFLSADKINIAVQINGKTKAIISIANNAKQDDVEKEAKENQNVKKILGSKKIKKTIYVSGRVINFVLE